jgi:hypothetical protein
MKTLMFVVAACLFAIFEVAGQEQYATRNGYVSFFSEAPVANVDAANNKVKVTFNSATKEVVISMAMADFNFKNNKMGRDAENKYLETLKYPEAGFKGKIHTKADYDKPGSYKAIATGKISVHGVEKQVAEKGTVVVGKGKVTFRSEFYLLLKDFGIATPKILGQEMTEDKVLVKIDAQLIEQRDVARKK